MNNQLTLYPAIEKLKQLSSVQELNQAIKENIPFSMDELKADGLFVFGVGKLGQRVYDFLRSAGIRVNGFLDNNPARQNQLFNGLNVSSPADLPASAIVYIASATYFNPIYKQLLKQGLRRLISHVQAGILFHGTTGFPVEMYQENLTEDLVENKQRYLEVFAMLDDGESRRVFDELLQFRMTLDQGHIDAVHTQLSKEYFDADVIQLGEKEVYFDVGGFDGDSAENFIRFVNGKYKAVHIFEPDLALLNKAKERLKSRGQVVYNPLGIYDKKTTLYFDVTGGLDGIISDQGAQRIDTTTIDAYEGDRPTYIKFDVEGVEIEAINGASATISGEKPKLAIASYHYPKHLWQIPILVKQLNPAYTVRLRHYTDSVFDSIFYFV